MLFLEKEEPSEKNFNAMILQKNDAYILKFSYY